ncbi:MAG: CHC2 zinc finger domain-containing protein, partial [Candidatus Binatia bacterium]
MALNFEEIKKIRIIEVCARYGIALRYRGDYANGVCKLPTHKQGDKTRTFSVNVAENYWRCFSDSCNAKNQGRKGGDVINLVALLENCSEFQAAEKLATWYGLTGNGKPPTHRSSSAQAVPSTPSQPSTAGENGKPKR